MFFRFFIYQLNFQGEVLVFYCLVVRAARFCVCFSVLMQFCKGKIMFLKSFKITKFEILKCCIKKNTAIKHSHDTQMLKHRAISPESRTNHPRLELPYPGTLECSKIDAGAPPPSTGIHFLLFIRLPLGIRCAITPDSFSMMNSKIPK